MQKTEKWNKTKIKDIAKSIHTGGTPRRNVKEYWENGDIPWLKISDLKSRFISNSEEKITKLGLDNSSARIFPKGTVLFSIFASLGATGILDFESATNQAIAGIIPDTKIVDTKYLYYCLISEKNKIVSKKSHSTQDNINLSILKNHEIKLPSIETQKNIVQRIEKAEKLRELRKESDTLTDKYLNSVFLKMFGDPKKNLKAWEIKKMATEIDDIRYGTGSPPKYQEKGIPFIRATNIKKGTIQKEGLVFISEQEASKIQKCKVKTGDLILVRSGVNTGDCALIPNEYDGAYAAYDLIIQIQYPKNYYFNFLINSNYGKSIVLPLSRRAGQPHINAEQIKSLQFPFPPINLLEKFAQIIKNVEAIKQAQKLSEQQIDDLFNGFMQKAFRGESC